MQKPAIDPKRTGVKASMIPFAEPAIYYDERNRLCGPLGAFLERHGTDPSSWVLCCPGCGEAGSPRDGAKWTATKGSFDAVTTLTLEPSIQKSCCGWHGYLEKGQFVQQRSEASAAIGITGEAEEE